VHIRNTEEFVGNLMYGLSSKFKDSAPSSREDSDFENNQKGVGNQYDVQKYDLNKTKFSVVLRNERKEYKNYLVRKRKKRYLRYVRLNLWLASSRR